MGYDGYEFRWAPYVSVGQKLAQAKKRAAQIAKKQKREPSPVELQGRKISASFWGKAWCDNLQAYSDFSNRLPRGATYVRNGSVVDLVISKGSIEAIVAGSEPYTVKISISVLAKATWKKIRQDCSASIDSLIDLLGGRLSDGVMRRLTEKKGGCFPAPSEIKMNCSCPDYSYCCKHIAAVMYGVGSRLDAQPELLFALRGVDHLDLVSQAVSKENLDRELASGAAVELSGQDLGEMFGIELDSSSFADSPQTSPKRRKAIASANAEARAVRKRRVQKSIGVDAASKATTMRATTKKVTTKKVTTKKATAKKVPAKNLPAKNLPAKTITTQKATTSTRVTALSRTAATRLAAATRPATKKRAAK